MAVEPFTASAKIMPLATQTKLPGSQEMAQRGGDAKKSIQNPSLAKLSELAADVEKNMNIIYNVDLQFSVNKETGRVMVTVTDEETGKVIREIPPSELIRLAEKFGEMVGMPFGQKG